MIYYIFKYTFDIIILINNLLIFSFKKALNPIKNYFNYMIDSKAPTIKKPKLKKRASYLSLTDLIVKPEKLDTPNKPDKNNFYKLSKPKLNPNIFKEDDLYFILDCSHYFDYSVKYLSNDRLYGWFFDIEQKQKFINPPT